jgi:hypothetical protein
MSKLQGKMAVDGFSADAPWDVRFAFHLADFTGCRILAAAFGGVVEWLMAPVLKTGRAQALVGSNPTPSAKLIFRFRLLIRNC